MVSRTDPGSCDGPAAPTAVPVVVFDMSQLTFARSADRIDVSAPLVGSLAAVPVNGDVSDREAVFRALDAALASAHIPSTGGPCRVVLLNPVTGQVAVGPVPDTVVFTAPDGFDVPPFGVLGEATFGPDAALVVDGIGFDRLVASTRSTQAALAAH